MLVAKYILKELLWKSVLGVFFAIILLLGLQSLRLGKTFINFEMELELVCKIYLYLASSFLPIILPLGAVFAIFLSFARLNSSNELLALKTMAYKKVTVVLPFLFYSIAVSTLVAFACFQWGPLGNRNFEKTIKQAISKKIFNFFANDFYHSQDLGFSLFSESSNKSDSSLNKVFFRESNQLNFPSYLVAKKAIWKESNDTSLATLSFFDGSILAIRENVDSFEQVFFERYDFQIKLKEQKFYGSKAPINLTGPELWESLKKKGAKLKAIWSEIFKRMSLASLPIFLLPLVFSLGWGSSRRKASNAVLWALTISISYWLTYMLVSIFLNKTQWGHLIQNPLFLFAIFFLPNILCLLLAFIRYWVHKNRVYRA